MEGQGKDMGEKKMEKPKRQVDRKRRVKRIRNGILLFLLLWILWSTVTSIILSFRVVSLQRQIDRLLSGGFTVSKEKTDGKIQGEDKGLGLAASGTGEENLRDKEDTLKVYLTFDDGPSKNTDKVLDILDDYGIKATFFVVGHEDPASRAAYSRIVNEGHTIGMHSYSHNYKEIYSSKETFTMDYKKIHDLLLQSTGVDCHLYRFPGGTSNKVADPALMGDFISFLSDEGTTYFDWNSSASDATTEDYTADDLVENVMNDVLKYKTSVVLMHDSDDKDETVEALPVLIEKLEAEGAVFLPISEDTDPIQHLVLKRTGKA